MAGRTSTTSISTLTRKTMTTTTDFQTGDLVKVVETFAGRSFIYRRGNTNQQPEVILTKRRFWEFRGVAPYWSPERPKYELRLQGEDESDASFNRYLEEYDVAFNQQVRNFRGTIKHRFERWMPISVEFGKPDPYRSGDCGLILKLERNYLLIQFGRNRGWVPKSYLALVDTDEEE